MQSSGKQVLTIWHNCAGDLLNYDPCCFVASGFPISGLDVTCECESLMVSDPISFAPASMAILLYMISPFTSAEARSDNNSSTAILALTLPKISAFLHLTSPSMLPVGPTTSFPLLIRLPFRVPSIRKSPLLVISPLNTCR